ncbi:MULTISPECIES: hypothetical protein [unclassified Ketobacter]|mgnify:FL=1|jgi:hypothetical protein|uniref:hypothetical protein n=1 Tax=unclassified Ketobacter TaxID=2639109 RepID=UPI0025C4BF78|nr:MULTISPECIES: hypothetical protein [unclassified Ketobacter]MCK5790998.1 hypothetical protein [Ketobacter sp.]MEC8812538.1 hypothetical protein [Pseudomonadota bacterium]|tara:strand:- start:12563 stop:12736 length:174 start_codon:yes stop_codon:yes gene_type:complete
MFERIKKALQVLGKHSVLHRALYFCLFLSYGAGCLGLDKLVVSGLAAVCYLALAVRS